MTVTALLGKWWAGASAAASDTPRGPLVPLRLFRNRIFAIGSVLCLLIGWALFGAVVFLPLFLQVVAGRSAASCGVLLLPLTAYSSARRGQAG